MKVSYTRRAVLRAAVKGHVVKTRDLKASKSHLKARSSLGDEKRISLDILSEHRQNFRHEGRVLHLAYNFAKGTPYGKVEGPRNNRDLPAIAKAIVNLVRCPENPVREWLGLEVEKPKTARELVRVMRGAAC